jgi:RNA polymerase sigma-70 factor (ECF subfamily)
MKEPAEQTLTPPVGHPAIPDAPSALDIERYMGEFVPMLPDLKAYLRSLLHNQEDADDAVQETFLIVRDRIASFDTARDFPNWVRGIARNVALRKRRSHGRARSQQLEQLVDLAAMLAAPTQEEPRAAVSEISAVRAWVSQLGADQQRIVMLRYVDRLDVDEISRRLGKSEAAIYMAISRMRSSLQHCVEKHRRLAATPAGQGLGSPCFADVLSCEMPPTPADDAASTTVALRLLVSGVAAVVQKQQQVQSG